jgi:mono/diheme cytochrome c family protein
MPLWVAILWHRFSSKKVMWRKFSPIIALIALLTTCACHSSGSYPGPPHDDTTGFKAADQSTARGQEIFRQRCMACHGINGNFRNNNAADLQLNKLDSIGIVTTIKNGKGAMPMFAGTLQDSDIAQLEMYVKTLRK